ncbi:MAG: amidase family protein, partial [Nocardioidaceae bacterium]
RLSRVSERVRAVLTVVMFEAEPIHHEAFALDPDSYGPDLAELLARGPVSAVEVETARVVVASAVSELHEAFSELDLVMSATVPIVAPRIGELHVTVHGHAHPVELLLTRLTSLANAAGLPAVSMPAPGERSLPVGVQFVGRSGEEGTLLSIADLLLD